MIRHIPTIEMDSIVGKIQSVSCKDFVSYDKITFYPGEYLNLILGPNGTGKSTLLAAIVIGLGGSEKLLSRMSGLENYVKNGKKMAWICIKIYKDTSKHTVTFERSFRPWKGSSEYKVSGSSVRQAEFLAAVRKYNIQVDNLCQFLPQDLVQDFAKMNPQELFASTIHSVCHKSTIENLEKLKMDRKTLADFDNELNQKRKRQKELDILLVEHDAKIQHLQSRTRSLNELNICMKKKAWLECNELKEKMEDTKREVNQTKTFVERDDKTCAGIKKEMDSCQSTIESFKQSAEKKKNEAAINSDMLESLSTEFEQLNSTIRRNRNELREKMAEQSDKEEHLKRVVYLLEASKQVLNDPANKYISEDEIEKQNEKLNQQIEEINSEMSKNWEMHLKLTRQLEDNFEEELGHIKWKIHTIENVAARRLQMLQDKFEDVYNAVIWLRRNRHLFQCHIYEPMLLEVNVKNASYAIYFENSIRLADLLAFTCVDKEDFNLLIEKVMHEQGLKINVIHSDEASACNYKAHKSIESYTRYGLHSFLIDMVEGPASILNYLCREYHIHQILIGHNKANNHADDAPKEVFLFFTPEYKYSISYSKYSGNKSLMREHLSSKNLLCTDINKRELAELKQRLKELTDKSDVIKNERSAIERKISELKAHKQGIFELKRANEFNRAKCCKWEEDIHFYEQKIESIKKSYIDIEQEEKVFREVVNKLVHQCMQNRQKTLEFLQKYEEYVESYEYYGGKIQVYEELCSDLRRQERIARQYAMKTKQLFHSVTAELNICLKEYNKKLKGIRESCDGKLPDSPDFPYTRKFKKLPDDIPSLKLYIQEVQLKLNCFEEGSDKILEQHEELRGEMETLKAFIETYSKEKTDLQSTTSKIHDEWCTKISEVVKQINSNFTRLMRLMEFAGEVQLISNDPYDYDNYGIQILVQYRNNTKLQVLDRYVQSGGERSVAIAVYSLSLQHLSHAPFRCVDEINQGMDPRNETKVFELLVDETCREGQPQYFFISPKLLPELKYNDLMTVHIVSNAKCIDKSVKFI